MIGRVIFASLISLVSLKVSGQISTLSGRIMSTDSVGIPYALVKLQGTLHYYTTDSSGHYYLDGFLPIPYELSVDAHHYIPKTLKIDVTESSIIELDVVLESKNCDPNRPNICPFCKNNDNVIPITYGLPTMRTVRQAKRGKVMLGGCIVTDCDDYWHCTKHKLSF